MCSKPRFVNEAGAGTVLALAIIAIISGLLMAMFGATGRLLEQARLNALAENAAIAGADALRGLAAGPPCEVARELVLSGSAHIMSCSVIDTDLLIQLEKHELTAKARAGESFLKEN